MLIKRLTGVSLFILLFVCQGAAQLSLAQQNIIKPIPKQERATTRSPAKISQQPPGTNEYQKASNNPPVKATEIKPTINDTASDKPYDYQKQNLIIQTKLSKSTGQIADLTLFLVVVGFIQGIIFLIQVFLLRGTLSATKEAANAATKAAKVAEDALHVSERAYLNIDQINFKKPIDQWQIGESIEILLRIFNQGHTYAQIIEMFNKVEVAKELPEIPTYWRGSTKYIQSTIAAGNRHTIGGLKGPVITEEIVQDILKVRKMLYVWGRLIYQDVFKKQWVVGFGAEYSPYGFLPVEGYSYIAEYEPEKEQS